MDSLNFNSVETLPNLSARAAFQVNSSAVFKEDVDIVPVIIDDTLSYVPWGGDNNMPFYILRNTAIWGQCKKAVVKLWCFVEAG